MPITTAHLKNALEMYLNDHVTEDNDITQTEMDSVKKHFDNLWDKLRSEATKEEEEEE